MFKNKTFFWPNLLPEPHLLHSALDWAHIPQSDAISALTAHGLKISWDLRGEMSANQWQWEELPANVSPRNQWKYIAHLHRGAQACLKILTGVTLIVCQSL